MARYLEQFETQLRNNNGCVMIPALMLDDIAATCRQSPAYGHSVREARLFGPSEEARPQAGDSSVMKWLNHQHFAQEFVLLCPNIQRLTLAAYYPGVQNWLSENLNEFSQLGRLCLHRNRFESGILALRPFFSGPLRRLKITGLGDRIIWHVSDEYPTCQLQRLTLNDCAFDMDTLASVLSLCSSLLRLKLGFFVGGWPGGCLFLVIEKLRVALTEIQSTIESITITFGISPYESKRHQAPVSGNLVSLAGFSRLKELAIPLAVLYGYNDKPSNALQLHEILPFGLTSLSLTDDGYDVTDTVLCPNPYLARLKSDVEELSKYRVAAYASTHGEHSQPPVLHITLDLYWTDFVRVAEELDMDDLDDLSGIQWNMAQPQEEIWCKVTADTWRDLLL